MAVNLDKPQRWKADIIQSIDMYNDWFINFAPRPSEPRAFRYFDGGYLGYEATEGIDWVWEHRIDDLAAFGL